MNLYVRCIFIIGNLNVQISLCTFCILFEINEMLKKENLFNKAIINQIHLQAYYFTYLLNYLLTYSIFYISPFIVPPVLLQTISTLMSLINGL